jgi:hypothetical protein
LLRLAVPLALVIAGAAGLAVYRRGYLPRLVIETGVPQPYVRFLDDGRLILVLGEGWKKVELWSAETGDRVRTIEDPDCGLETAWAEGAERAPVLVLQHVLSPGPTPVVAALRFVSAETGADLGTLPVPYELRGFALSPRGDLVAVSKQGGIEVWKTPSGPRVRSFVPRPELTQVSLGPPRFSRDGERLTVPIGNRNEAAVLSLADGSVANIVSGESAMFDDRGELLVGMKKEIAVFAPDGRLARKLPWAGPIFQTGGSVFVSTDRDTGPFDVRSLETGELRRRIPFEADHWWFLLSPQGDRLAIVRQSGRIEIWEIRP